jgi:hypothetical protein
MQDLFDKLDLQFEHCNAVNILVYEFEKVVRFCSDHKNNRLHYRACFGVECKTALKAACIKMQINN